jgi:hypothetical protein
MKVLRKIRIKTDRLEIGDQIKVKFSDEKHYATAIRRDKDGMLFLLDDCLDEAQPMNKEGGTKGGYDASDLRKFLAQKANEIPEKLKNKMVAFDNGDYLRLLTLQEARGRDNDWNECEGQIEWMKDRRHRMATIKDNGCASWWLRGVVSAADFAFVYATGTVGGTSASDSLGVRPAFKISLTCILDCSEVDDRYQELLQMKYEEIKEIADSLGIKDIDFDCNHCDMHYCICNLCHKIHSSDYPDPHYCLYGCYRKDATIAKIIIAERSLKNGAIWEWE